MEGDNKTDREVVKDLLLAHRGQENPISAREINEVIEVDTVGSFPRTRELVRELLFEEKIPVAGGNAGYYVVETKAELTAYLENLDSRMGKIAERRYAIRRAAQGWDAFGEEDDTGPDKNIHEFV